MFAWTMLLAVVIVVVEQEISPVIASNYSCVYSHFLGIDWPDPFVDFSSWIEQYTYENDVIFTLLISKIYITIHSGLPDISANPHDHLYIPILLRTFLKLPQCPKSLQFVNGGGVVNSEYKYNEMYMKYCVNTVQSEMHCPLLKFSVKHN